MTYDPMFYNPYLNRPFQQSQPVNGLVRIESMDDAKVYQLPPNSVSPPLFLGSENAFFIKTTDASGGGTLKKYKFEEEPIPSDNINSNFVTREYFDQQMNNIMEAINGKHSVSESAESAE